MIPQNFTLDDMQKSFRELDERFQRLTTRNIDMEGRRVINASRSVADFDYIIRMEHREAIAALQKRDDAIVGMLNQVHDIRVSTFAARGSPIAHAFTLFLASDRDHMGWISNGAAWKYAFGVRSIAQSAITAFTADLTTDDVGALINVTDFTHLLQWSGTALGFAPGDSGSGYITGFAVTPNGGTWGICDGTEYSYLLADGTTANFTTPNLGTSAYLKLGTSATIGPTAAGGTTASESAHTHAVDPPSTATGAPSAATTVNGVGAASVATGDHTHTVDIASFASGAGSAHSHGPGTLELRQTQLIGYFRR